MLYRTTSTTCPVCGADHASCGPVVEVTPVDLPKAKAAMRSVKPLRRYAVVYNGYPTTMRLSEEDAEELGGTPVDDEPEPDVPAPEQPEPEPEPEPEPKARTASNKARRARNK